MVIKLRIKCIHILQKLQKNDGEDRFLTKEDERNLWPFLELVGPAVQRQELMRQFLSVLS